MSANLSQGKCDLPCGAPCSRLPCDKRCCKELSCGHQCPGICGEVCPSERFCIHCGDADLTVACKLLLNTPNGILFLAVWLESCSMRYQIALTADLKLNCLQHQHKVLCGMLHAFAHRDSTDDVVFLCWCRHMML